MSTKKIVFAFVITFLFISNLFSEQYVKGIVTSTRKWTKANSPYIVSGNLTIIEGVTLTIEPGVTVNFSENTSISVFGEIVAIGTPHNPITFTPSIENPVQSTWGGIKFEETCKPAIIDTDNSYLKGSAFVHCVFEWAGSDVDAVIDARAGDSGPFISNCKFRNLIVQNSSEFFVIHTSLPVMNCVIEEVKGDPFHRSEKFTGVYTNNKAINNSVRKISGFRTIHAIHCLDDAIKNTVKTIVNGNEFWGILTKGDAIGNSISFIGSINEATGIISTGKADRNEVCEIKSDETVKSRH